MRTYKKLALSLVLISTMIFSVSCGQKEEQKVEDTTEKVITEEQVEIETAEQENVDYNELLSQLEETKEPSLSNFKTVDIEGNTVDQTLWSEKKVTMLNIWGTFCAPCIREMPDLNAINEEYQDKDFQIVGLVIDTSAGDGNVIPSQVDVAKDILKQTGVEYKNILPSNDLNTAILNQITSLPTTIFLDENGNIIGEYYIGSKSKTDWKKVIQQYLP